jgi:hypothetical protein
MIEYPLDVVKGMVAWLLCRDRCELKAIRNDLDSELATASKRLDGLPMKSANKFQEVISRDAGHVKYSHGLALAQFSIRPPSQSHSGYFNSSGSFPSASAAMASLSSCGIGVIGSRRICIAPSGPRQTIVFTRPNSLVFLVG